MSNANRQPLPLSAELEEMYDALETLPEDLASEMMAQFVYQLGRRMDERGWSQKQLAEEAGMRPSQLSRLFKAENTSLITVARLAHALGLAIGALKLIPEEDVSIQLDEVAPFVRTESSDKTWWPSSRRSAVAWGRKNVDTAFTEAAFPDPVPRPTEPEVYHAEGTEVGAFLRRVTHRDSQRRLEASDDPARGWRERREIPRSRGSNPAASTVSPDLTDSAIERCSLLSN